MPPREFLYGRSNFRTARLQTSHRFIDAELRQTKHMLTHMKWSAKNRTLTAAVNAESFQMKTVPLFLALFITALSTTSAFCAQDEGVALAIIYDTSGSMKEPVKDLKGNFSPKYVIANRALIAVANQIQAFTTNTATGNPRDVQTALFIFGNDGAKEAIKFGPFDAAALRSWAGGFSTPSGNTPLGNALRTASETVLNSPLPRKHVLIITDGKNTAGPEPAAVMPGLKHRAQSKQTSLSTHFVAFDVAAKEFDSVKKLGATVVGAGDEKQLNSQLEFILQKKILLEDEEPKK